MLETITKIITAEEDGATVRHMLKAKLHFSSHAGLHGQDIPGAENVHSAGVPPIDQNAILRPGEPGDGVGGKMKLCF